MRTVGRRIENPITRAASARRLAEAARFNEELQKLPMGRLTGIPKGLLRFRTHQEANRYDEDCAARRMALLAQRAA